MAKAKYNVKRGDTPVIGWLLTAPSLTFNWANILYDLSLTSITSPTDNSGAAITRLNQAITVDTTTNNGYIYFQPTHSESAALIPKTTYFIEWQLKDTTNQNYATPVTETYEVLQDYII